MEFASFSFLLFTAAGIAFWFDSLRSREIATGIAREYCRRSNFQFLDGTASLVKLQIDRHGGTLKFLRTYQFDFTDFDHRRRHGWVGMRGRKMLHFILDQDGDSRDH